MNKDYSIHYRRWHSESSEHLNRVALQLWSALADYVPLDTSTRVLDVGCGFGFALQAFRQNGYTNLKGVEISEGQARVARLHGFDVDTTADVRSWLQSKRGGYDLVLLLDVLEHIPKDEQLPILEAIRGSMSANGKLLITVPNANSILASRWRYIDYTHECSFTEHSLGYLLRLANFSAIQISNEKGLQRFPRRVWTKSGRQAVRKWIVRWFWLQVYLAEIPNIEIDDISFDLNLFASAEF